MKQRQKKDLMVCIIAAVIAVLIPLVSFAEENEEDKILAVVGNKKIYQRSIFHTIYSVDLFRYVAQDF